MSSVCTLLLGHFSLSIPDKLNLTLGILSYLCLLVMCWYEYAGILGSLTAGLGSFHLSCIHAVHIGSGQWVSLYKNQTTGNMCRVYVSIYIDQIHATDIQIS